MARKNIFAAATTLKQLDEVYDIVASPENVACDGELSKGEVAKRWKNIKNDYITRRAQLRLGLK